MRSLMASGDITVTVIYRIALENDSAQWLLMADMFCGDRRIGVVHIAWFNSREDAEYILGRMTNG